MGGRTGASRRAGRGAGAVGTATAGRDGRAAGAGGSAAGVAGTVIGSVGRDTTGGAAAATGSAGSGSIWTLLKSNTASAGVSDQLSAASGLMGAEVSTPGSGEVMGRAGSAATLGAGA